MMMEGYAKTFLEEIENAVKEIEKTEECAFSENNDNLQWADKNSYCIQYVKMTCNLARKINNFLSDSKEKIMEKAKFENLLMHRLQRLDEVFQQEYLVVININLTLQIIYMYSDFGSTEKVIEYSSLYANEFFRRRTFSEEFKPSSNSDNVLEEWKTLFSIVSMAVKKGGKQLIHWHLMHKSYDYIESMKTVDRHHEAFGYLESIYEEIHTGMHIS